MKKDGMNHPRPWIPAGPVHRIDGTTMNTKIPLI
jgi:hypothetical protein